MISESTQKVLEYVKNHSGEMLTKEMIAKALGLTPKEVVPMINYWAGPRGGFVIGRTDPQEVVDENGVKKTIKYVYYKGQ